MGECKRNCWTCGWDNSNEQCAVIDQERDGWERCEAWYDDTGPTAGYPPTDADGCPGWQPKPGAENTDRAQIAALAGSATPTVKEYLMVRSGWRGNLPICRGPGGIVARRMMRAGVRR